MHIVIHGHTYIIESIRTGPSSLSHRVMRPLSIHSAAPQPATAHHAYFDHHLCVYTVCLYNHLPQPDMNMFLSRPPHEHYQYYTHPHYPHYPPHHNHNHNHHGVGSPHQSP